METKCGTCGKALGTTGTCEECQQFLMTESAKDMDEEKATQTIGQLEEFLKSPPWYTKFAPKVLWARSKLLGRMAKDSITRDYKEVPWPSIASIAVALVYVVSPIDLIPDVIVPVGWTDDMVVVGLVMKALGTDLRKYVEAKGLNPKDYDL